MSELEEGSEPKRELTGIARAVDALFHAPGRPLAVVPGDDESTGEEPVAEDPNVVTGATPSNQARGPGGAPPSLPDEPTPFPDEPPPLPDELASTADEPPPFPDEPPPLPDELASTVDEPPPLPPDEGGVEPRLAERRSGPSQGEDTPLDDAVASLLDGTGSVQEVTRLADEMLEQKALDPVARAVAALVLAAGEPPDAGLLAIAERLMSPVVLGRLVRRLAGDPDRRPEYVQVARIIGRPMAAAVREEVAESIDPVARDGHVAALVGLGEQVRAVVQDMAESDNRFLVRTAVEVLGTLGGPSALPLIRNALANADARVRGQALRSLQALEDRDSESLITAMLEDSDGQVRTIAAAVAAEFGFGRAVGRITTLLDESAAPDETIELLGALGRLGDPGAVPSIEKYAVRTLFSKPPTEVRIAAYEALHRIGTPHAKQLVQQAAADKDPRVGAFVNELAVRD